MKALFANDAVAGMVDKTRIALLGLPVWKILHLVANDEPLEKGDYQKALDQDDLKSLAGRYELHEKNKLTVDITISLIPNKKQAIFLIRDVTQVVQKEQKLMEERLAYTREKVKRKKRKRISVCFRVLLMELRQLFF